MNDSAFGNKVQSKYSIVLSIKINNNNDSVIRINQITTPTTQ